MIEKIFLLLLIALAITIVFTPHLKRAVIYLSLFSLLCAILFLQYGAPDVAIAQAIIGSGLSTILYLVAMKQADHFIICIICPEADDTDEIVLSTKVELLLEVIKSTLKYRYLDCQIKFSDKNIKEIVAAGAADLILCNDNETIKLYGISQECNIDSIMKSISKKNLLGICRFEKYQ